MDYEALIKSLLAQGKTTDDVAKEFADALNKYEKSHSKEAQMNEYLRDFDLHRCYEDTDGMDLATLSGYVACIMAKDHPEWTKDNLVMFKETLQESLPYFAATINRSVDKVILDMLDKYTEEVKPKVDTAKDKVKDSAMDAAAKLDKFLRDMGL